MSNLPCAYLDLGAVDVHDLLAVLEQGRATSKPALASAQAQGVPIYDCAALSPQRLNPDSRRRLMTEWQQVLAEGAGVLVLAGAWPAHELIDEVSRVFEQIVSAERDTHSGGDHFAQAGSNDRIWNALQKLCLREPALFAHYYGNPWLALICAAWLGPGYQVTSQVNCVNPGGAAQQPHRDYHLGFVTPQQASLWPRAAHRLSPVLTLQGAVAHADMPLASGPTLLLPHSQKYEAGYLVQHDPAFDACFAQNHVQLPLERGDAVFFNPALMHAAGSNRSANTRRLANLLQVSSAFGRAMESVDRIGMSVALYPALRAEVSAGRLTLEAAECAIAACAEGYAFPTNLDLDPPLGGLAPPSHQALMRCALSEGWDAARFTTELLARAAKQRA